MSHLSRALSVVGGWLVIVALGAVYIALAVTHVFLVHPGEPLAENLVDLILIGGPGLILLYGGSWLPRSDIHTAVYPRVVSWCLGGLGLMLGVVILLVLNPSGSVDDPVRAAMIATGLGSLGGFGLGVYNAQAITRARIAEQRTREVEHYSAELERQNERLESFAGMLAHELRNPLQIAQIYHQQSQPRNEDASKEVATAHERMEEMIDVLLITVRGTDANIDYESVPIAEVATEAWADVSEDTGTEAEEADLVVEAEQTIQADPVHLEHLLRNLFRNSLEHADQDVTVRVGDLPTGFYIADDGPGIPEDVREDVTAAGFTTKADGIGLGLTFVAQLAETYEWELTITESQASGARFEMTDVDLVSTEVG